MSQNTQADTINYIANQIYIYGHIFIIITGLLGNTLSIVLFLTKLKESVSSVYLVAFYSNNTFALFIYILPNIIDLIYGTDGTGYILPWCILQRYFTHVCMVLSPLALCLASVDRYFCSSREVSRRQWSSMKIARIAVSVTVLASLCFAIPDLVYRYVNTDYHYCTASDPYWTYLSYFLIPVVITCIPLIILSVSGYKTYRNLRGIVRAIQPTITHNPSTQVTMRYDPRRRRLDNQLARMLLVQILCFFFQSMLYTVVYLYLTVTYDWPKDDMRNAVENLISGLIYLIYDTSMCISFYLYYSLSKSFRAAVKNMLTGN